MATSLDHSLILDYRVLCDDQSTFAFIYGILSTYHTFAAGLYSHCGRRQIDSTAESASYMLTRDNHVVGVMSRCESNKSQIETNSIDSIEQDG